MAKSLSALKQRDVTLAPSEIRSQTSSDYTLFIAFCTCTVSMIESALTPVRWRGCKNEFSQRLQRASDARSQSQPTFELKGTYVSLLNMSAEPLWRGGGDG